jgi:2-polyprenyl-3-methyl-5-hydroxy-6-metoxy-1,4-benzoquinol methylase
MLKSNRTIIECYLCGSDSLFQRTGCVRDNPTINVLECNECGLVFLSSFDHITETFYENSGMHTSEVDREAWQRETAWDDERRVISFRRIIENKSLLDFGCGNGGFLIRAREVAHSVKGIEADNCLKEWFAQEKLPVFSSINETPGKFNVITLFHVLEHIADPRAILMKLAERLEPGGQLIVELPSASDALLTLYKSHEFSHFTYWSCHLYLFTSATLAALAKQSGLQLNYIRQLQRYPLSNHLYWLANGKPGGHQHWGFMDSTELHAAYEKQLAAVGACDTIIASLSRKQGE